MSPYKLKLKLVVLFNIMVSYKDYFKDRHTRSIFEKYVANIGIDTNVMKSDNILENILFLVEKGDIRLGGLDHLATSNKQIALAGVSRR